MDVSFLDTTASSAVNQILGFDRFDNIFTRRLDQISVSGTVPISALIFDAVAPPPVKPRVNRKTNKTTITQRKRRLKKRSMDGGGEDDGGLFGYDGGDDGGGFGGGWNFGGGGGGWNFGGFGENNWDDWSFSSASDPASDFVHEVVCWIALSNCVHFAFKKVARGIGELVGQHGREKVPLRLGSLC